MTSSRPYLIRAVHEWIIDNGMTPHILVNAEMEGVHVPPEYVKDGQISLNISTAAVHGLSIDNDWILFDARFGGKAFQVSAPVASVRAIFARENGAGMSFGEEETDDEPPPDPDNERKRKSKLQPSLKVVK